MPVLVYHDKGQSRRKRFAPKTRTGCVNCKARHLKCGEERPSCRRCDVSCLKCSYKLPKTWLFDPKSDSSEDGDRRSSLGATTPSTDSDDTPNGDDTLNDGSCSPQTQVSTPSNNVHTYHSWRGPGLFRTQHEHNAFSTWVTFLVRHCEPRSRLSDTIDMGQDIWGTVIPQIAYHSAALREVLISCGILVLSVRRKIPQSEYDREMALVLSHATRAIHELATHQRPLIEVVLTAYTLWSLDTISCRFESAMVHGLSAVKIARQCRKTLASDELASTFVQHMVFNLPGPDAAPPPEIVKDPPVLRRMKAAVKLEGEYNRITACAQRVAMSDAPGKHDILAILEESRQEIQWVLLRYNTLELHVKWILNKEEQAANPAWKFLPLQDKLGFFQPLVKSIDEYIVTADEDHVPVLAPVDLWRKISAQELLMFMVMVAGTDLSLRYITLDFFEVSRQIRWPGRHHT